MNNYDKDATIINLRSQNKINTSTANSNNNIKNVITTTNNNNNKNATTANLLEMIWKSMGQGILLLWLSRHAVTFPGSEKEKKYKNTLSFSKQQIIADQSLSVLF